MAIKVPAEQPHYEHPAQLPIRKLRDATQTLRRVDEIWQSWAARTPARLEMIKDGDQHSIVTVVRLDTPPPIDELNVPLRNCVHDGRSALDNLMLQLARRNNATEKQLRRVAFLVADSESEWNRSWREALGGLSVETVTRVRNVQPFSLPEHSGPRHPLAMLHDLWNADKHRDGFTAAVGLSPRARGSILGTLRLKVEPEHVDEMREALSDVDRMMDVDLGPIVDGTRLLTVKLPEGVSLDALEYASMNAPVTLALVGPGVSITDSAIASLANALRYARDAVRYVADIVDAVPVAFPPGIIERSDELPKSN
jgi:hypothetical protein